MPSLTLWKRLEIRRGTAKAFSRVIPTPGCGNVLKYDVEQRFVVDYPQEFLLWKRLEIRRGTARKIFFFFLLRAVETS